MNTSQLYYISCFNSFFRTQNCHHFPRLTSSGCWPIMTWHSCTTRRKHGENSFLELFSHLLQGQTIKQCFQNCACHTSSEVIHTYGSLLYTGISGVVLYIVHKIYTTIRGTEIIKSNSHWPCRISKDTFRISCWQNIL